MLFPTTGQCIKQMSFIGDVLTRSNLNDFDNRQQHLLCLIVTHFILLEASISSNKQVYNFVITVVIMVIRRHFANCPSLLLVSGLYNTIVVIVSSACTVQPDSKRRKGQDYAYTVWILYHCNPLTDIKVDVLHCGINVGKSYITKHK